MVALAAVLRVTAVAHLLLAGLVAGDATRRGRSVPRWTALVGLTGVPGVVAYWWTGRDAGD